MKDSTKALIMWAIAMVVFLGIYLALFFFTDDNGSTRYRNVDLLHCFSNRWWVLYIKTDNYLGN